MYTKEEVLAILKRQKPELEKKYPLSELGVFGSYARGDYDEGSDIDILVDFHDRIDGFQLVQLAHDLTNAFKFKVDVVTRGGIRPGYLPFVEKNLIHV